MISIMDVKDTYLSELLIEENMSVKVLAAIIMNFLEDGIDRYKDIMHVLQGRGTRPFVPNKLNLDLQNKTTPPAKPSVEESSTVELKDNT